MLFSDAPAMYRQAQDDGMTAADAKSAAAMAGVFSPALIAAAAIGAYLLFKSKSGGGVSLMGYRRRHRRA